jgi:hypothetical protein
VAEQHVILAAAVPAADAARWRRLSAAAAGLAADGATTVALLGIDRGPHGTAPTFVIDVFGAESADDLPTLPPATGPADLQVARALFTLRDAVGTWVVAAPDPDDAAFPPVAAALRHWLLACPTDDDGLIAAYQQFKRAFVTARTAAAAAAAAAVFLLTDDAAHAAVVHPRLRKAAHEFLKTDLGFAGVGPVRPALPAVRVFAAAADGLDLALWPAVLDELMPAPADDEAAPPPALAPAAPAIGVTPAFQTPARPGPARGPGQTRPPEPDVESALDDLASSADDLARTSVATATAMLDHLAQVLDPEERAALAAGFDEPDPPEFDAPAPAPSPARPATASPLPRPAADAHLFDIRTQVIPPVIINVPTPAPATPPAPARKPVAPPPARPTPAGPLAPVAAPAADKLIPAGSRGGVTLRAFDLHDVDDRPAQWEAVERSVRDLVPDSILLEARPPMSWATDSCIAIAPDGRLHVWTLYKDGASWYALREWASEHRNLLALTRRDLVLSKDADVAVHIVLPMEPAAADADRTPTVVNTLLRTATRNIHVYRLRPLTWNGRRGLVVVPIA